MTAPRVLRLRGRLLELGPRPLLMGILNATPDSFSDARRGAGRGALARGRGAAGGGRGHRSTSAASRRAATGPRCPPTRRSRASKRWSRALAGDGALVSVDTYKPAVAEAAIAAGAAIVNDVSGLRDPGWPRSARARARRWC